MTTHKYLFACLFCTATMPLFAQQKEVLKDAAIKNIDAQYNTYKATALQIWDYAEVGFTEFKSSEALQNLLKTNGFDLKAGVADMPTAFVATFGEGKPVIGILAEFDALPGLAQTIEPTKKSIEGKAAGHACGHHLFGTGSVAAAIELKNTMLKNKIKGTIKVYGTPAEEGGGGKIYMVREGLFEGVDVVLHWHAWSSNLANAATSLANISVKFQFYGTSSHAAGAPERGRSALDGVEAMNNMANMMREHVPQETRMHYIITDGGKAPNVVPDFAEVYYYIRHPNIETLKELFERLVKCAKGAALGTETRVEYEVINGVYNLLPITILSQTMHSNLTQVGGVKYNDAEMAFGKKIQESFPLQNRPPLTDAEIIQPYSEGLRKDGGSTDVGDVSWVVPTVGLRTATWIPGTGSHSWQAVACGGTDIGIKGMMNAAKTLTLTGIDLLLDKSLIEKATEEWQTRRGANYKYVSLLGNRKPPLDYQKK